MFLVHCMHKYLVSGTCILSSNVFFLHALEVFFVYFFYNTFQLPFKPTVIKYSHMT